MTKDWPELALDEWKDTFETLHLWTQIVGKIRLKQTPWINHSWHVPLYVTPRGLTTSMIPYGGSSFEILFDLVEHVLRVESGDGRSEAVDLRPQAVAEFYAALMMATERLGLPVSIHGSPNEVESPIPFAEDYQHNSYDAEYASRLHRILVRSALVFQRFRAGFLGKSSPVHFFWGSFDLAVTRFSGRSAPEHPGGVPNLPDWVAREAYSHEVSSCGFWPGGGPHPYPLYYAYAYPEPAGFAEAVVLPGDAFYSTELREFVLPYDSVRAADDPDKALLNFLESTYAAAADLGGWDRETLECPPGWPGG
ncbi:MAG: DUF5996 family protein [Rhodothermales bacterium]|nr:DUF5996 family protein [Rhodothermales bacterium]